VGFTPLQMTVTIDSNQCTGIISSNIQSVTCTITQNPNSTPKLRAGSFMPIVEIGGVGFAKPVVGVSPLSVGISLTSLTTSTGPLSGGILIGLDGSGFPYSTNPADPVIVTVCDVPAVIKSVTNT
jgi:hypothetical protein